MNNITSKLKKVFLDKHKEQKLFEGLQALRKERDDYALILYSFSLIFIASIVSALNFTGKINFTTEIIIFMSVLFYGKYLLKKQFNKNYKEKEKLILSRKNKFIKEAINEIEDYFEMDKLSIEDFQKICWLFENPSLTIKEKEIEVKNFINEIKER